MGERKKILRIYQKYAYRYAHMDIFESEALFFDSFKQAALILETIVQDSNEYAAIINDSCSSCDKKNTEDSHSLVESANSHLRGYPNNIIAFCADRGHGKTSAMLSFSKTLEHTPRQPSDRSHFWEPCTEKSKFKVLAPIDPTTMESHESILRIILSRIFSCFEQKEQNNPRNTHQRNKAAEVQQNLITCFKKCYRSLDVLNSTSSQTLIQDDIEKLAALGDSSALKVDLTNLIHQFLDFWFDSYSRTDSKFLVIQIDDADMNLENAYSILEDLRKYFVIPNVVLLLSANMVQLEKVVEQHYLKSLKRLNHAYNNKDVPYCHDVAEKYIDKALPCTHQIHLPIIDHFLRDGAEIELHYVRRDNVEEIPKGYQQFIVDQIRKKTGIILIPTTTSIHNFLPSTMRELSFLLDLLQQLPNLIEDSGGYILHEILLNPSDQKVWQWQDNLQRFVNYFIHEWAAINLTQEQRAVLADVSQAKSQEKLPLMFSRLKAYYESFLESGDFIIPQDVHNHISNRLTSGNSIADARYIIMYIDELQYAQFPHKFMYALQFYLSIHCTVLLAQDMERNGAEKQYSVPALFSFLGKIQFPWKLLPGQFNSAFRIGGYKLKRWRLESRLGLKPKENSAITDAIKSTCYFELLHDGHYYRSTYVPTNPIQPIQSILGNIPGSIVYDPLNAYLTFPLKNLTFSDENYEGEMAILLIAMHWDLQYRIIRKYSAKVKQTIDEDQNGNYTYTPPNIIVDFFEIVSSVYKDTLERSVNFKQITNRELYTAIHLSTEDSVKRVTIDFLEELKKILERYDMNDSNLQVKDIRLFSLDIKDYLGKKHGDFNILETIPELKVIIRLYEEIYEDMKNATNSPSGQKYILDKVRIFSQIIDKKLKHFGYKL